eukprot:jgi/Bigna1/87477/estExt_fgenesh1_pg.C_200218
MLFNSAQVNVFASHKGNTERGNGLSMDKNDKENAVPRNRKSNQKGVTKQPFGMTPPPSKIPTSLKSRMSSGRKNCYTKKTLKTPSPLPPLGDSIPSHLVTPTTLRSYESPLSTPLPERVLMQVNQIKAVLFTKKTNWKDRSDALESLRAMADQKNCMFTADEWEERILPEIVGPIQTQLTEIRSKIIIEVCETISVLVNRVKGLSDEFVSDLTDSLCVLTGQTTKCMAAAGEKCLTSIMKYILPKTLEKLIARADGERHPRIRSTCIKCISLSLEKWPQEDLVQFSKKLVPSIKNHLSAAALSVRNNARMLFKIYKRKYPRLASEVYSMLSPPVRRQMARERPEKKSKGNKRANFRNFLKKQRSSRILKGNSTPSRNNCSACTRGKVDITKQKQAVKQMEPKKIGMETQASKASKNPPLCPLFQEIGNKPIPSPKTALTELIKSSPREPHLRRLFSDDSSRNTEPIVGKSSISNQALDIDSFSFGDDDVALSNSDLVNMENSRRLKNASLGTQMEEVFKDISNGENSIFQDVLQPSPKNHREDTIAQTTLTAAAAATAVSNGDSLGRYRMITPKTPDIKKPAQEISATATSDMLDFQSPVYVSKRIPISSWPTPGNISIDCTPEKGNNIFAKLLPAQQYFARRTTKGKFFMFVPLIIFIYIILFAGEETGMVGKQQHILVQDPITTPTTCSQQQSSSLFTLLGETCPVDSSLIESEMFSTLDEGTHEYVINGAVKHVVSFDEDSIKGKLFLMSTSMINNLSTTNHLNDQQCPKEVSIAESSYQAASVENGIVLNSSLQEVGVIQPEILHVKQTEFAQSKKDQENEEEEEEVPEQDLEVEKDSATTTQLEIRGEEFQDAKIIDPPKPEIVTFLVSGDPNNPTVKMVVHTTNDNDERGEHFVHDTRPLLPNNNMKASSREESEAVFVETTIGNQELGAIDSPEDPKDLSNNDNHHHHRRHHSHSMTLKLIAVSITTAIVVAGALTWVFSVALGLKPQRFSSQQLILHIGDTVLEKRGALLVMELHMEEILLSMNFRHSR